MDLNNYIIYGLCSIIIGLIYYIIATKRKNKDLIDFVSKHEEKFYQIYNNSPDMIAIIERNGYLISDINATAERVLGYKREDVIGHNILETPVIYEEDKPILKEKLDYAFIHPAEIVQCKIRKISKNGDMYYIHESMFVLKNSGNNSLYMTCQDITDETKIKNLNETNIIKYQTIVDNINDIVFELDKKLNFTYVNKNILQVTGYDRDELIGTNFLELVKNDVDKKYLQSNFQKRFIERDPKTKNTLAVFETKNCDKIIMNLTTKISIDTFGNVIGIYGVAKDITEDEDEKLAKKKKIFATSNKILSRINTLELNLASMNININ